MGPRPGREGTSTLDLERGDGSVVCPRSACPRVCARIASCLVCSVRYARSVRLQHFVWGGAVAWVLTVHPKESFRKLK